MNLEDNLANITAQLYSVTTKKDGGGRIQFEFGMESLLAIQKIQNWNAKGGMNFTVVVVPTDLMEEEKPLGGFRQVTPSQAF